MSCLNDDGFGPLVVGCRDDFDFTKKFEQFFLSVTPNLLFIVIATTRICRLIGTSSQGHGGTLLALKLLVGGVLLGCTSANLYFVRFVGGYGGYYDMLAASMATASSVVLVLYSVLAHTRMARPSDGITLYLLLSFVCDAIQLRTYWLAAAPANLTALLAATTASKLLLLVLELKSKLKPVKLQETTDAKERSSSAIGKLFLWWLNYIVRYGYGHTLRQEDLYPLDKDLSAHKYGYQFMRHYRVLQNSSKKSGKGKKWKVLRALAWALGTSCLAPILPRLALGTFAFAHPFFINSILDNLSQAEAYLTPGSAVAYVGIIVFLNVGSALATSAYSYRQERATAQLRSCLVPALYQKTVRRKIYSEKNSSVISLMNSEINMIQFGAKVIHEFWICIVEIALACWLLKGRIGWAFLAPLGVVLFSAGGSGIVGRFTATRQRAWMEAMGCRVGLTTSVIPNLPSIKMSGLERQIGRFVQLARETEIKLGNRFRVLITASATVSFIPTVMCPIITFTVAGGSLSMTDVMTSLAFLNLLSHPMVEVLQTYPQVMAALASIARIEEFLDSENDDGKIPSDYQDGGVAEAAGTIRLSDASFGWEEDTWVVKDISLTMQPGTFNYIVGGIATGKTTLCLGLLDEVKYRTGVATVNPGKQLAYCSQDAFIINGTIRDNIVGFAQFDAARYERVIKCCQLQADFNSLTHGDETVVGTQGAALSGGQKKRVSLARALFAEPEVAIFDDILGGVDSHTAQGIAREVFGSEGMLRKRGVTVVFLSQSTEFVDLFDKAAVLKNGTVTWHGSAAELPAEDRSADKASSDTTPAASATEGSDDSTAATKNDTASGGTPGNLPMVPPGHHDEYGFFMAAVGPRIIATFFVLAFIGTFLYTFSSLWLEMWVAAEGEPAKAQFFFRAYWVLQLACLASLAIFFAFSLTVMGPRASSTLHFDTLRAILLAPLDYYTTVDSSVPTGYMSQDMNVIDNQFTNSAANTIASALISSFQLILIAIGSPAVLLGYPIFLGILSAVQRVFVKTSVQLRALAMEGRDPIIKHFTETLDGLVTIRAFGWSANEISVGAKLLDKSQQSAYLSAMLQAWLKVNLSLCIALIAAVFVGVASQFPASTGLVGVALVTFMSAGEMLSNVIQNYTMLQTSAVGLSRLKFLQDSVKPEEKPSENVSVPELWPRDGAVSLENVVAAYKTSTPYPGKRYNLIEAGDPDDALKSISLAVQKGENALICGRTGSGKSTLLRLLQGFITPKSGVVNIDGYSPAKVDRSQLRDAVIALPQAPFFLPGEFSVRENLEHHRIPDLSLDSIRERVQVKQDEDCIYALQTVGLWDMLSERGGLDVPLKDGSLSRGQKQLFSLARAILRQRLKRRANEGGAEGNCGLLLLDEFNTGLDVATETVMWNVIKAEFSSCTIICVAHRLGAASDFDRVFVMHHGCIVEEGVPAVLLEQPTSKFRAIWSMKEI